MTNEELAARVKAGEPGALMELWEDVRRFVEMKARRYARAYEGRASVEDLTQTGFFAVLDAAEKYDVERENASFLSLLSYTLKTRFAEENGTKTSKRDALQYCRSLDEPAYKGGNADREGDSIVNLIEDEGAALAFEGVEYADFVRYARMVINAALDTLTEAHAALLTAHYLEGRSMERAEEIAGFSCKQSASDAAERAAYRLANGKYSHELRACFDAFNDYREYRYAAQVGSFTRYQQSGISSTEAEALVK